MCSYFFFTTTSHTEIYTLSLHDALPIWGCCGHLRVWGLLLASATAFARRTRASPCGASLPEGMAHTCSCTSADRFPDRKSTRLNSSHSQISYAVFCLKKKRTQPLSSRLL